MKRYIVSATYGQVAQVKRDSIIIYIDVEDIHNVYAPITSTIKDLEFINGKFRRKVFQSTFLKIGRAIITVKGFIEVKFYLEVGKPKYVTDRVRIDNKVGEKIKQGQIIGEILLGSLSEIFLPQRTTKLVKKGDFVKGGKTKIASYTT